MAYFRGKYLPVTSKLSLRYRTIRYYWANRSLLAWKRLLAFSVQRRLGRPVPAFVDIATTYRCQCRCVHCSSDGHKKPELAEMTTDEIKSIIDQAKEIGALEIVFSGGEPLLRKDAFELIRHAHDAGMITRLNTNGLLLNRRRAALLKKAGLTLCGVSIDDPDPEIHDDLRGVPGTYQKALAGIRYLREFGVLSQMLVYASKQNLTPRLKRMVALGEQLGASTMFIFFPIASGRWETAFDQVLNAEERARARGFQDLTFAYSELPTAKSLCVHLHKLILYVTAYGEVTPCPVAPFVIGSLRRQPLKKLWRQYAAQLDLEFHDDCPLNNLRDREVLRNHIESFRRRTGSLGQAG